MMLFFPIERVWIPFPKWLKKITINTPMSFRPPKTAKLDSFFFLICAQNSLLVLIRIASDEYSKLCFMSKDDKMISIYQFFNFYSCKNHSILHKCVYIITRGPLVL